MKLLKRITTTISASVDSAVRQIENHDALVEASIKNAAHHVAETKVRLLRVQKEGARLSEQLQQLHEDENRWEQRARELAQSDQGLDEKSKSKALACLKRRNTCQQQIKHYASLIEKQSRLEADMTEQLDNMLVRLDEVKLVHNQMRSRSANAELHRVVSQLGSSEVDSLDDIIDRWDVKLTEVEIGSGDFDIGDHKDSLESQYLREEEHLALNAEFEKLARTQVKQHD